MKQIILTLLARMLLRMSGFTLRVSEGLLALSNECAYQEFISRKRKQLALDIRNY
jgi:hypothetical protein